MKELILWISALRDYWAIIVGGGGGLVGLLFIIISLAERFWGWTMPKLWYSIFFIFGAILIASFLAWRDEHRKVIALSAMPKIEGEVYIFAVASAGQRDENSLVTLMVRLRNTGSSTSIYNIKFMVIYEGKEFIAQYLPPPRETVTLLSNNPIDGSFLLKVEDHFMQKSTKETMINGGQLGGWVQILVSNLSNDKMFDRGSILLSFKDVYGNVYRIETKKSIDDKQFTTSFIDPLKLQKK
jgi:hypothetical protein